MIQFSLNKGTLLFSFCILLGLFAQSSADPIPYKDCGSAGVTVNYFDISGCKTFPCVFQKNSNVTLNLNFTSNTSFKALKNLVYGTIVGVKVPFPLPQSDACKNGIQCPVNQSTVNDETISLAILPEYPSVSVVVQFVVQDDTGKTVICALFPAKIQ